MGSKKLEARTIGVGTTSTTANKANSLALNSASKLSAAVVIAVCIVAMLAASSIAVSLVTYFSSNDVKHEDPQLTKRGYQAPPPAEKPIERDEVPALLTKLANDFNVPRSQIIEMLIGKDGVLTLTSKLTRELSLAYSQLDEVLSDREDTKELIANLTNGIAVTQLQLTVAEKKSRGKAGKKDGRQG